MRWLCKVLKRVLPCMELEEFMSDLEQLRSLNMSRNDPKP